MDLSQQIDRVDDIAPAEFKKKYLYPQKPLLIKGGVLQKSLAFNKWSIPYFKKVMGELSVPIYDGKSEKWKHSACTEADLYMKFGDYLDLISKDEPTDLRMFLFNGFKAKPELSKDFPCPNIFKGVLGHIGYMFFGGKDSSVRMHQDIDMSNVLLTQFAGRKKVLLFAPEYSPLLYRTPFNTFSIANFDNPDYDKFPGLKYVKGYEIIMEPGDSLFMPAGYWHYMTYLDGGFAVSYRKMTSEWKTLFQAILYLTVYMFIDKIMNKFWKEGWIQYKYKVAFRNADKMIKNINKGSKQLEHTEYVPSYF